MFSFHFPVQFNVPRGSVRFRADVGIGPYIRVIYRDELIFAVISRTLLVMASSFAFRAASTRRMA